MQGLMMDYQLNVPAILRRADELHGDPHDRGRGLVDARVVDLGEIAAEHRPAAVAVQDPQILEGGDVPADVDRHRLGQATGQ